MFSSARISLTFSAALPVSATGLDGVGLAVAAGAAGVVVVVSACAVDIESLLLREV